MFHRRFVALLLLVAPFAFSSELRADAKGLFEGRPAFKEGIDRGYYVWHDNDGWHVRWMTFGQGRTFTGSVVAEGGELKSLERVDIDSESRFVTRRTGPTVVRGPRGRRRVAPGGTRTTVVSRDEDHIEKDGDRRIVFRTHTTDDLDGFDFKVDKHTRTLRFVLEVAGESRAVDVEVGARNQRPSGNPFAVNLD